MLHLSVFKDVIHKLMFKKKNHVKDVKNSLRKYMN